MSGPFLFSVSGAEREDLLRGDRGKGPSSAGRPREHIRGALPDLVG